MSLIVPPPTPPLPQDNNNNNNPRLSSCVMPVETPLLDQSHLKPGHKASLLSHSQTLELYRQNAKKTNDPDLQFEFAAFMVEASRAMNDEEAKKKETT